MTERFVSTGTKPTPHQAELLTILTEECAEVQQRATKMLRFGVDEVQPGQSHDNAWRLGLEVGELLHMIDRCKETGLIPEDAIVDGRVRKRAQLAKFLQTQPASEPYQPPSPSYEIGAKVTYLGRNGYDGEKAHADTLLIIGDIYTLADVGSWSSSFRLVEMPGETFNTVMFADASAAPMIVKAHADYEASRAPDDPTWAKLYMEPYLALVAKAAGELEGGVTQIAYRFYDANGVLIEEDVKDVERALEEIKRFVFLHAIDPDAGGADAQAGRVEFEPVREIAR